MEYPNSKFTRPYRLAMLTIFILAFFIITPLIILRTAGYRYDWRYGLFKETGSISIDELEPKNITVYLNGLQLKGSMPFRLNNITPNKYQLKINAPGYYDWQKEIEVASKQTVYIKQFSLIKKNKPTAIADGQINNLALAYNGGYLAYLTTSNKQQELWLFDTKLKTKFLLFKTTNEALQIVWFKNANYFILANAKPPFTTFLVYNAANPNSPTIISTGAGNKVTKFLWSEDFEPVIYFSSDKDLYSYSLLTHRRNLLLNNLKTNWYFHQNQLWTITPSNTQNLIINQDVLGFKNNYKTLYLEAILPSLNNFNWQILAIINNQILLKKTNESGNLLITAQNNFYLNTNDFFVSPYNEWWLFWSPWELWTYSLGDKPYLLNRSGEELKQVAPLDQYNTLGLVWKNKITVLFPYYYISHDFINGVINKIQPDTNKKTMYFSGIINKQNGLWQINY